MKLLSKYKFFFLFLFVFPINSNAQSNLQNSSFTDPSVADLRLAQSAISSCDILHETTKIEPNSLSSQEFFNKLQQTDSDGNLLIEGCSEDILEFVSSLCSSDSDTNRLFCSKLGFEQVSGTGGVSTDSYKSFGSVALGGLDLSDSNSEVSSTSGVSALGNDNNKSTFSIAGVLFAFTPVKRLKLASSFVRSRAVVSRPVLNGAMLILATLGLASCGDVTEPVAPKPVAPKPPDTPCTRGESGYFQLTNSASDCIKLINAPVISYLDEEGNVITDTSTITNHSIKVTFEEPVSFIDASEQGSLTSDNITKMIDIKLGSIDLLDVGFGFTIEIESNESSFTLTPETNYSAGDYTVGVSNYAKKADVSKIASSTNKSQYLSEINKLFSPSNFKVETPCSRGEDGYFELQSSNGLTDCIKLATPTISYLDKEGDTIQDTSTISDHKIKVTFDGRVSFINSDRYEGLTAAFARGMIELDSNGTNLLTDTFGFSIEAGVEQENSFFILTPQASYPVGNYSVKVKNYVNSSDAAKVVSATNTESYLLSAGREYSSFSTPNISTLCESGASGYFKLTNADGSKNCIRIPQAVFTFTPRGGRELIHSNWDPTSVIKIYFDSEVVYLKEDGTHREITKEDILEMVEISGRKYERNDDRVNLNGPIGLDLLSVSHAGGKTVITIDSPYDPKTHAGKVFTEWVVYDVIVNNFARKSDVSKIASSSSIGSYLEDTKTFYHGDYGAVYAPSSCDVEYRPQAGVSYASYHDQYSGEGKVNRFTCDTYTAKVFTSLSDDVAFDGAMLDDIFGDDKERQKFEKADPNTRYVIDAAFIFSDALVDNAVGDWRAKFEERVIKNTNRFFQRSGINVEIRASVMEPFSKYRHHLLCDLPSFDNLFFKKEEWNVGSAYGQGEQFLLTELLPLIRKNHPADIIFSVILGGGGGASIINASYINHHRLSRWSSRGVVRVLDHFFATNDSHYYGYATGVLLAHEIGHVLGLNHDIDTLLNAGVKQESLGLNGINATGFGYGYGGYLNDLPVATIMSYRKDNQFVPIFSADKEVLVSELCEDIDLYFGYCRYHNNSNLPNSSVRIGGPYKYIVVDSSEAAQYTIKTVSEYSDIGVAPLDLSTVSNAITAAQLMKDQH